MKVKNLVLGVLLAISPALALAGKGGDCGCKKSENSSCAKKSGEKCECSGCKEGSCSKDGKTSCEDHPKTETTEKKK